MTAAPLRMTRAQADELAARALELRQVNRQWTAEELQLWRDFTRVRCGARGCIRTAMFVFHHERGNAWGGTSRFTFLRCEDHPHPTGRKYLAAYLLPDPT